ncbi:MAG: type 1 glutamine amidotransferase domain-containing protein [Rhizobiales bacterium]|nr:type 1 glutamine amidotransferase domain-containing protein [Hyphomicrobiales bacterium]
MTLYKTAGIVLLGLAALGLVVYVALPPLLGLLGLQPNYKVPAIRADGRRALIIATSHDTLDDKGTPTGVAALELTGPYYVFSDAGMTVDLASIKGGAIPFDAQTLRWPMDRAPDRRYMKDEALRQKAMNSLAVDQVDFSQYDIILIAGGWGAAFDLATSDALGDGVTKAWANEAIVSSVCHGALGLLKARDETGAPLVKGRKVTGATDKQIRELKITSTPWHPERDLRAAGADFESATGYMDIFTGAVVTDGRLVTGQNQNVSEETAYKTIVALNKLSTDIINRAE